MAADSLHRRLRAQRVAAEAARGWKLARCRPGAGGGPYHSPRGEPPPAPPMARTHRLRGPGPEGFSPRLESRGGAAPAASTAYLFLMCAPRRHGNHSIFSGVTKAPLFQTFPGRGLRGCPCSCSLGCAPGSSAGTALLSDGGRGVSIHSLPPNFHHLSPFSGVGTPIPGISEISLPLLAPFPHARKFFDLRDPTSPKAVGTQRLHSPNGNPLLPSSSPARFPWPRSQHVV